MCIRDREYIAYVETPYKEKFGIPRQSGLAESTCGEIIFTPKFRNPDAVRGIEEFSHLWLLWEFSRAKQDTFHAVSYTHLDVYKRQEHRRCWGKILIVGKL